MIQKPWYNSILPKMGFNRHFLMAVIFGPLKYQGKQLDDYKVFQYTSHLARFVGYLRRKDEIGNLLRIQMDQHQLVIRSSSHFLELLSSNHPYGEMTKIQFYGGKTKSTISPSRYRGAWNQNVARQHDVFWWIRSVEWLELQSYCWRSITRVCIWTLLGWVILFTRMVSGFTTGRSTALHPILPCNGQNVRNPSNRICSYGVTLLSRSFIVVRGYSSPDLGLGCSISHREICCKLHPSFRICSHSILQDIRPFLETVLLATHRQIRCMSWWHKGYCMQAVICT